ncbi:hypothetical protein D046_9296, partial [Vibrio parahaemolyticus V-223/04]
MYQTLIKKIKFNKLDKFQPSERPTYFLSRKNNSVNG